MMVPHPWLSRWWRSSLPTVARCWLSSRNATGSASAHRHVPAPRAKLYAGRNRKAQCIMLTCWPVPSIQPKLPPLCLSLYGAVTCMPPVLSWQPAALASHRSSCTPLELNMGLRDKMKKAVGTVAAGIRSSYLTSNFLLIRPPGLCGELWAASNLQRVDKMEPLTRHADWCLQLRPGARGGAGYGWRRRAAAPCAAFAGGFHAAARVAHERA